MGNKMKKVLWSTVGIVWVISMLMSGCGVADKIEANITGTSEHCINGVTYIQFAKGVSVAYNIDGTVRVCK